MNRWPRMKTLRAKRHTYLLAIVFGAGTQFLGIAQTATKLPPRVPLTIGVVEGNTYKNSSLGLEFTPSPGLRFSAPELKGTPGSVPLLVTVGAWSGRSMVSANRGTVFYADDLGYYPEDRRSTRAYVERVVRNEKNEGLDLVEGAVEGQLGGVTLARVDFRQSSLYEIVLIKACEVYAFVFIFAAEDLDSANALIAQTKIKIDMAVSGCRAMTEGPPQKK